MNIEFIKWMVGYAEGFKYGFDEYTETAYVKYYQHRSSYRNPINHWAIYPLLLQRAIEGINDNIKHEWMIIADGNNIEVHDIKGLVDGWAYTDIDKAKEQALKYICEQEDKIMKMVIAGGRNLKGESND